MLSVRDRLFYCVATLQCGITHGMLQGCIETHLTLRQLDAIVPVDLNEEVLHL